MRIAIVAASTAGADLARQLARSGHEVILAPRETPSAAGADVVVVAAAVSEAEAAIESAAREMGPDSFVVALFRRAASGGAPRATLGDLSHEASPRVVRLALALRDAGVEAEVSLDIHAAIVRLRSPHDVSAGGEGPGACRRC
jgi:hypothetical protein